VSGLKEHGKVEERGAELVKKENMRTF